jgi:hypothetical protein
MIFRPLSLCTFLAAAFAGLHLYQSKHEVALLDRELRGIARAIDDANERSQSLQAEWAWLNEPERLRGVAQRHLQLEPMQPTQFLRLNEAERRLPQLAAYEGPKALFAERPPVAPEGAVTSLALLPRVPEPVQVVLAEPAPPEPPAPIAAPVFPPQSLTQSLPLSDAPPRPAAPPAAEARPAPPVHAARAPEPVREPVREAVRESAPRAAEPKPVPLDIARIAPPARLAPPPRPAPRQATEVASLPPIAAPLRAALAPAVAHLAPPAPTLRPAVTQVATAPVPRMPAPRMTEQPVVSLGSALGGGRPLLAPPVPFGSANAATLGGTLR